MSSPQLYRGNWPQNVSKLAKYGVRFVDNKWKVAVLYEAGAGLTYLAVQHERDDVANMVNVAKAAGGESPGGAFYVNEFRHVIVPVRGPAGSGANSVYYFAGTLEGDLEFEFEGSVLTSRPVGANGASLAPGDRWVGPRPGIPYVLKAGGEDIYYETPALTEADPPAVRTNMTQKFELSKVLKDAGAARAAAASVKALRGHQGGRFYVNEHGAMFSPVSAGDGNGIDYVYCGAVNREAWFSSPTLPV